MNYPTMTEAEWATFREVMLAITQPYHLIPAATVERCETLRQSLEPLNLVQREVVGWWRLDQSTRKQVQVLTEWGATTERLKKGFAINSDGLLVPRQSLQSVMMHGKEAGRRSGLSHQVRLRRSGDNKRLYAPAWIIIHTLRHDEIPYAYPVFLRVLVEATPTDIITRSASDPSWIGRLETLHRG